VIQHPAVSRLLDLLDESDVDYMISGSVASMFYGEPRLTHDVDIVVDIDLQSALGLQNFLTDEYYISEEGIRDALANRTMFNIIHHESGLKIDFWILTDSEFDKSRFNRRVRHKIAGRDYFFSSPEDTILIKLLWKRESDHGKHIDDVRSMVRIFPGNLDYNYLKFWITKLGLKKESGLAGLRFDSI